jgi:UDP-N-acetylmuramoyl-L-alanyl-D-glutamate--2,6-diaminopimelate ligase
VNLVLKTFSELLACANVLEKTATNAAITAVEYDSRKVKPGALFVAMRGESTDGNKFISAAIEQGAAAVVTDQTESFAALKQKNMPAALVQHGRRALAAISAEFFSHPEAKLKLHGITGTNGKTTTAFLLEAILRSVGRECVLVGTVEYRVAGEVLASPHTTPESRDLMEMFAHGVEAGATDGVMEMSSHALEQERVWGLHCDTAIFTNLTQDHLDYHGTMEKYLAAKRRLFEGVGAKPPRAAVLNADDMHSNEMLPTKHSMQTMLYGIDKGDYRAEQIELAAGSTQFILRTPSGSAKVQTHLTGRVNVYNALAAICAAMASGIALEAAAAGAARLDHVPGRFQVVRGNQPYIVVVDYAHTPDALRNLTSLAHEVVSDSRVLTLFGCGGNRDRSKRPLMGRAAGDGSDLVVLTSDNPRNEDPQEILEDALPGVIASKTKYIVEPDRHTAIGIILKAAKPGDMVLLAGKGHEKVQILRDRQVPFDDVAEAEQYLKSAGQFSPNEVELKRVR